MNRYITDTGEILLYTGAPDLNMLDQLAKGPGDLWHSSYDQGFKNCFPEIVYQTATFWWFINDFENTTTCINWRVNLSCFVIREKVWTLFNGFDARYNSEIMQGVDLGYTLLRELGGVPIYVKDLYEPSPNEVIIKTEDRYVFYRKHFKTGHSIYMMLRQPLSKWFSELYYFVKSLIVRATKKPC